MTKLSVNINKLATLRNSRGKNNPDILDWARRIESFGAHGITVHPRPDGRHIRFADVRALGKQVVGEFNIEGFPDRAWLDLVREVQPHQATLVPDPPEALTSNSGFDVSASVELLRRVVSELRGIRVSVFVDPIRFSPDDARCLADLGVGRIELYTERYAETFGLDSSTAVLEQYKRAAAWARAAGLGVNAGHDLSRANLRRLVEMIPKIDEVSIGHALICDALEFGMANAVRAYLNLLSI